MVGMALAMILCEFTKALENGSANPDPKLGRAPPTAFDSAQSERHLLTNGGELSTETLRCVGEWCKRALLGGCEYDDARSVANSGNGLSDFGIKKEHRVTAVVSVQFCTSF
jgi:hypothetical protein